MKNVDHLTLPFVAMFDQWNDPVAAVSQSHVSELLSDVLRASGMSVRAQNICRRIAYPGDRLEDLVRLPSRELEWEKNCGPKTADEIRGKLGALGIYFYGEQR